MVTETRRKRTDGLAFTLLEMLLTVALLVALLGAVVFNFESARRGSDLEEGARQVEALIKFAAAEAASRGKSIQFRFGDEVASLTVSTNAIAETSGAPVNDFEPIEHKDDAPTKLRVVYELDPVQQPGVFVDLAGAGPFLDAIAERVRFHKIQSPERPMNLRTNDLTFVAEAAVAPVVTFYPDGSSETADIVLASVDREDFRQIIIRIDGVTGAVRRELKAQDELVPIEWMDDENPEAAKGQASAGPTTAASPATETPAPAAPMPEDPAFETPKTTAPESASTNFFDDNF